MVGSLFQRDRNRRLLPSSENLEIKNFCTVSQMLRFLVLFSFTETGIGKNFTLSQENRHGTGKMMAQLCNVHKPGAIISFVSLTILVWFQHW